MFSETPSTIHKHPVLQQKLSPTHAGQPFQLLRCYMQEVHTRTFFISSCSSLFTVFSIPSCPFSSNGLMREFIFIFMAFNHTPVEDPCISRLMWPPIKMPCNPSRSWKADEPHAVGGKIPSILINIL